MERRNSTGKMDHLFTILSGGINIPEEGRI
jgi:hypothetical protein